MAEETRNIVIVGASFAGLQAAHYTLKHTLPALKAGQKNGKYHVYLVAPSAHFYYRIASPRVATSTALMAAEKSIFNLREHFAKYSKDEFTFVEAAATGLDTASRTLLYRSGDDKTTDELSLQYHALIVATGSTTNYPAFSASTHIDDTLTAIKSTNERIAAADTIVIAGGGATGVEFAGEVAEFRNGKPGWFSSKAGNRPKTKITLITSSANLLPTFKPAVGAAAAKKIQALGVEIMYNTRVLDTSTENEITTINLSNKTTIQASLYIPTTGLIPNSAWLPTNLLTPSSYLNTNPSTLRVDLAGPRVYALGDIASYSNNTALEIPRALDTLAVNLLRDLTSYDPATPDARPAGSDREFVPEKKEMGIFPIGTGGGVGVAMGWRVPSCMVWAIKGRDYMVGMNGKAVVSGETVGKAIQLVGNEVVKQQ